MIFLHGHRLRVLLLHPGRLPLDGLLGTRLQALETAGNVLCVWSLEPSAQAGICKGTRPRAASEQRQCEEKFRASVGVCSGTQTHLLREGPAGLLPNRVPPVALHHGCQRGTRVQNGE